MREKAVRNWKGDSDWNASWRECFFVHREVRLPEGGLATASASFFLREEIWSQRFLGLEV